MVYYIGNGADNKQYLPNKYKNYLDKINKTLCYAVGIAFQHLISSEGIIPLYRRSWIYFLSMQSKGI